MFPFTFMFVCVKLRSQGMNKGFVKNSNVQTQKTRMRERECVYIVNFGRQII